MRLRQAAGEMRAARAAGGRGGPLVALVARLSPAAAGFALLAAILGVAAAQPEAETGAVEGRVRERAGGAPLSPANVLLLGTRLGSTTGPDGRFHFDRVPAGRQVLEVTFMGYRAARDTLVVSAGGRVRVTIDLDPAVVRTLEAIEIRADRPLIDIHRTATTHALSARDLEAVLAQAPTVDAVVEQQPGIVRDRGRLHFRGGRADESLFVLDGIKVRDLLSGESSGTEIASRSAQEVQVMTGGFDARYSQAMSGVVETRLKEGTRSWSGALSYETDAPFDRQNLHQAHAEISGPHLLLTPLLRLAGARRPEATFYASLSTELSNGYLPAVGDLPGGPRLYSSVRDGFLGWEFGYGDALAPLAQNQWRGVLKSTWTANADNKLALSLTKTLTISQDWGAPDIGEIDRNITNFPWAWAPRLDHHYTITRDVNIASLTWNRSLGLKTRTAVRLWRHYSGQRKDVGGRRWDAYDRTRDAERRDDPTFVDTPYFVDGGDAGDWRDRYVVVWGLGNDWSRRLGAHAFEWGFSAEYQDVQYMALNAHTVDLANNLPLGDEYDLFHVTPNAGSLYLQDRFEHEGMSVNLGLAYDYWFPGEQVEKGLAACSRPHFTDALQEKFLRETHAFLGRRFKGHMSPRLGVSFPISEQAHLFFNYGHYSQRPPYYYVYAKSSSQSGEEYPRIGNPTLNPQISVSYEVGSEYQLVEGTALRGSLFWKDMYDYPTSIRLVMRERATARSNFFMYWNMDYARTRGIELSLLQSRRSFLAGSLSYTYSVGKGKSSDPNKTKVLQETGGDSREPLLDEEFLWWNRPHKLTAQINLRVRRDETPPRWLGFRWPDDLQARLYFAVRSGRAYTPYNSGGQRVGDPYSRSGPIDRTCDFSLSKGFPLAGRRAEVSFNVYNLFGWRTPLVFDAVTGEAYRPGVGSLTQPREDPSTYGAYLAETVAERTANYVADYRRRYGRDPDPSMVESYAAGVAASIRYDYTATYYSAQDPSYLSAPRTFRLGISYAW
ncbi:MAG: TonB-dependent receptor [Candidatus Eisenbacteria bacterium]|uniref:TonB-dependent receptor n=1 Tax=Eiseniibacteriota bacterium TaxID=2212470 RepID=A0A937X6B6_UNCEI|nr:TonB-dependent receptor [Candidatus Eisenbacteria bacterium]